jgi:methylase of polypeptide subunit release factors
VKTCACGLLLAALSVLQPALGQSSANKPSRAPDVIYLPSPPSVVENMLALAKITKKDVVYDLGCGDGRIVIEAARRYGVRAVGIDIDPRRIADARENAKKAGVEKLVEFRQADLFESDLREATVVTLYLLPRLNVKLMP